MRESATTLFRFFMITMAAVCVTDALASCPATMPAREVGPIAANGPFIVSQCPEACNPMNSGIYLRREEAPDYLDTIYVWCDAGYEAPIPATSTCWNCVDGCAGVNCPPGELCIPIARSTGSDCRRFVCDDPAYTITESTATSVPYCRRTQPCPSDPPTEEPTPISILLDGPTVIPTGGTCTWSAEAFGGKPYTTKTYTWYHANGAVGWGQWYTGGRPSGVLFGSSWMLRVDVTDGVTIASKEIWVKEATNAPICMN